jgi:hypothetical protein
LSGKVEPNARTEEKKGVRKGNLESTNEGTEAKKKADTSGHQEKVIKKWRKEMRGGG